MAEIKLELIYCTEPFAGGINFETRLAYKDGAQAQLTTDQKALDKILKEKEAEFSQYVYQKTLKVEEAKEAELKAKDKEIASLKLQLSSAERFLLDEYEVEHISMHFLLPEATQNVGGRLKAQPELKAKLNKALKAKWEVKDA
jgi:uncharacterized membrane-anchored protein YjiN (DUF445 family)